MTDSASQHNNNTTQQGVAVLIQNADEKNEDRARPPWLLFAGAAIGLGLATLGLLETPNGLTALPASEAARVGDRTIRLVDYQRVLAGVEGDMRNPIDDQVRRRVLDRMIDEELLVQRALDLGLAVVDRRVRGELTSGLIDSIVGEADADEASERDVARHFEESVDFFSRPGRLHAHTIFFSTRADGRRADGTAIERAEKALAALRAGDETPGEIERRLADPQISTLPKGMLPPSKVRDYVGPIILQTLSNLDLGAWSDPIKSGGGIYLVRVIDREGRIVPDFDDVKELVRQDLKRRRGDEALRLYLDDLRTQNTVEINQSLFAHP